MPGTLVDGVVDGHDGGHVGGLGVEGFSAHGIEEHLFRGVDPVAAFGVGGCVALAVGGAGGGGGGLGGGGGESARDGADFAVGVEAELGEDAGRGRRGRGCGLVEGGGVA